MTERALPTGTVTFLFSDMEGSTRLVRDLGPAVFTEILERHNQILRTAFTRHGATERGTQGDSFLVMFPEAPEAVAAAAEAQVALATERWPGDAAVRVRMGLHTGVGRLGGDDYVGLDVNRAARVAGLGHGGQVLLSETASALATDALPPGVSLRSLGPHRLRDLDRAETLHQLVIDGLRAEFPPLHTAEAATGNLPTRLTSFVGRETELATLERLLDDASLLTLTGPGGTGKTRLAIELARRREGMFRDGAWLVRLDSIDDPELVPAAIATTLELIESRDQSPGAQVVAFLADREILLVLDNFEQVLPAGQLIDDLLQAAPGVRVVVTSRSPLRLSLEQEYPVSPLGVPPPEAGADVAEASEAVRLFVERARRSRPDYVLAPQDAAAVGEICRRLDGLPLGIELAAARMGLMPARAIAERLTSRLDLPGAGSRDLPARQQTLAATIAWSHDLLDAPARRLLARLSVFAGGFRLDEAEAVAGPPNELGADVIDALSTLVDHSLAEPMAGPDVPRFRLLETIRLFAAERLSELGETEAIRERHALAYLALVEDAARHMPGRDQVPWLDRLSADYDNLRAALGWAVDAGATEVAHRLATASWRFWQFRGHIAEGRARTAEVLAMRGSEEPTIWRMRAHEAAGGLEWWAGNVPLADAHYARQLEFARAVGDRPGIADALFNLLHTRFISLSGDPEALAAMRDEARRLYDEVGDEVGSARLAFTEGYALMYVGHVDEARLMVTSSLAEFERLGDEFYVALAATAIGGIAMTQRDYPSAIRLGVLGLRAQHAMDDMASITLGLRAAAVAWYVVGETADAAVLHGAFESLCRRHGFGQPLDVEAWMNLGIDIEDAVAELRSDAYGAERQRGEAMTIDAALAFLEERAALFVGDGAVAPSSDA
jgi:predicted ATPase/class 3 adenylate cyclase